MTDLTGTRLESWKQTSERSGDYERTTDIASAGLRRPGQLIKRFLPKTLFGRSVLIIVMPLILLQLVATYVFYDRLWDVVLRRLTGSVAGEIAMATDLLRLYPPGPQRTTLMATAELDLYLDLIFKPGEQLSPARQRLTHSLVEDQLSSALAERVRQPFMIDNKSRKKQILVSVQMPEGILEAAVPRKRIFTSTIYIFLAWMVGTSCLLFAIAAVFMRNQVKSLRRLAAAADSFGKGRDAPNFKPEGATEIRQAASAFLRMRERIHRQIRQRTEMLAGVSHDLRTPLTRMKLGLELLPATADIADLKADVAEMETMVNAYLNFVRGTGEEAAAEVDLSTIVEEVATTARRNGARVLVTAPEECLLPLRRDAFKRALNNLVDNANRYGKHVWLSFLVQNRWMELTIDDDGPGIPETRREEAFRPFTRLDGARQSSSGNVGLGLAIARDIIRTHGGDLLLEESPQGGLRARVRVPL